MGRTLHEDFKWTWEKNVQGTGRAKAPDDVLEGAALDAETAHAHGPFFYRDGAHMADRPEFLSRADAKRASETPDEHAGRKRARVTTGA